MEHVSLSDRLQWEIDGRDWPNRSASRFVKAAGLNWHVKQFGPASMEVPVIVLLHGTGSSSHSWRDVAPRLAQDCSVIVMDLPGHAFTAMPPNAEQSLAGMSRNVAALLHELNVSPTLIAGHSAGPGHVSAALAMMAHWDLEPLERELPRLSLPVWMVAAENDTTVPATQAAQIARRLPRSHQVLWPMLGHLAHEESPAQCAALLKGVMDEVLQK